MSAKSRNLIVFGCVKQGDLDKLNTLLKSNNSPNEFDETSFLTPPTPLHYSVKTGEAKIVELLLIYGAEVNTTDNDGRTPLYVGAENGRKEIVELLLIYGAEVNTTDNDGRTPLYVGAENGRKEIVELLLSYGAKVNTEDNDRRTPLYFGAQNGHKETVELLLSYGAEVNTADKNGHNPLYLSAQYGHKEIVELLLSHGAEVNTVDKNGHNPLYVSAQYGHKEIVELLLSHRTEVNAADKNEHTPLYVSAQYGHKEIVELLLSYGAEVNTTDNDGRTPLYVGAENGRKEIVELLLSYGAKVNTADNCEMTPLHSSAYKGRISVVEALIKHGADIDPLSNKGKTPLMLAKRNGHKDIVDLLRKAKPEQAGDGIIFKAKRTVKGFLSYKSTEINLQSAIERYNMNHPKRGTAIIINNKTFPGGVRKGSDKDAKNMQSLLKLLCFENVCQHNDKTAEQMRDILYQVSKEDHSQSDCFVCVILSHGTDGGYIYGVDGNKVPLDDLVSYFKGSSCPSLAGKPKLFFIQACRGANIDTGVVESDGSCIMNKTAERLEQRIPIDADILTAHSVVSGYKAWRNTVNGSWFIQAVNEVFTKNWTQLDLMSMMTLVNNKVAYFEFEDKEGNIIKQMSCKTSTLRKQLFFTKK